MSPGLYLQSRFCYFLFYEDSKMMEMIWYDTYGARLLEGHTAELLPVLLLHTQDPAPHQEIPLELYNTWE